MHAALRASAVASCHVTVEPVYGAAGVRDTRYGPVRPHIAGSSSGIPATAVTGFTQL